MIADMKTRIGIFALCIWLLAPQHLSAQDFDEAVAAAKRGDHAAAYQIWSVLAEGGDPAAQFNIAMMYVRGEGVERDLQQAANWFRKSAEQGRVDAQARLGALYAHGQGVQQDFGEAARWLNKAAEGGDSPSQYDLAVLYANGTGVEQDYSAAYYWFTMAAVGGFSPAQEAQEQLRQMLPPAQISMVERMVQQELGLEPPAGQ
jgi:TPR repeat protein